MRRKEGKDREGRKEGKEAGSGENMSNISLHAGYSPRKE